MTHVFAGDPLDRAERERRDDPWIEARLARADSRFLPLRGQEVAVIGGSPAALAWQGREILAHAAAGASPVLLGVHDDVALFGVDVSGAGDPLPPGSRAAFDGVRNVATDVSQAESGTLAHAKSVVDWHARHRFCANCGGATVPRRGGKERACAACGAQHYPRTDPVVIMVVTRGDRCLLGRSARRASGFHSALAGFVDQGESIEEAVRREVREEAGIRVGEVRYHSSQPWPFPSSLMIGCIADALDETIHIDEEEVVDVRWFTRGEVCAALEVAGTTGDGLRVPGRIAIAHHLIENWAVG